MAEKDSLLNLFKSNPPRISRETYIKMKARGYNDRTVFTIAELRRQGVLI